MQMWQSLAYIIGFYNIKVLMLAFHRQMHWHKYLGLECQRTEF